MKPVRIVTLAQLDLMPYGTIVSPIRMHDRAMQFDVQGTLQLNPKARLEGRDHDRWLVLVDELPEVRVEEGRIYHNESVTSYSLTSDYPHRFVVWEEQP